MAPGVGKTYTMLAEAHRRVGRGEDVVVGFVETHGRPETAKLIEGLEVLPRRTVEYRGGAFEEMDTEAVIRRRPQWVLVDELAHTNVPGSTHAKRWQDVDDILDDGIDVISTVNIQHLESLNDKVYELTGVRVRETLPDRVVDDADEVVLTDLTPAALINRLRRGQVYDLDKVPTALDRFFTPENLSALRELSLRKTAEEVDEELREYLARRDRRGPGAQDRILVAVTARPSSARLVRRGYQLAERLGGKLYCLFVQSPGKTLSEKERTSLAEVEDIARDLGAQCRELKGTSTADEIIDFVAKHEVTYVVMGQSARTRVDEVVRGSIITKIMRETAGVDVLVVADPERGEAKGADTNP
jgi:two-component system sensor histidine kinase KdpD